MHKLPSHIESLKHLLKYANISENAMLVYSALIGLRPRSLGEIVNLTGLDHMTAERAVKELIVAKLAREIPGRPTLYEALPPYSLMKLQIEELINSVREFESDLTRSVRESIDVLSESLKAFSENISRSFENAVINVGEALENILTEILLDNVTRILEDVFSKILEESKKNTAERLAALRNTIISTFRNSVDENTRRLSTQTTLATQKLINHIRETLQEKTKRKLEDIINLFELSIGAIDALIVKGFEKEVRREYEIQVIRGLDKIKGQAYDIVKRTQNYVIIVAPTFDYIPADIILSLAPRVRVQIVAELFPTHQQILERLRSRGPTTQLRSMRNIRVFGVVADMREALVSAIPETVVDPHRVLGITTNDEAWVSFLQSEFSHIFMGASRI